MTVETEQKLSNDEQKLGKIVLALEAIILEDTFNPAEIETINQSLDVLKSKKLKITQMREELKKQRINEEEVARTELGKLRRILLKSKVSKKSKTRDISKEIERLNRVYSTYKEEIKRLERSLPPSL